MVLSSPTPAFEAVVLVVKIELWPGGDERRVKELGRLHIINRGDSPTPKRGNYTVNLMRRGTLQTVQRSGEVLNYARLAYPVWKLLRKALEALDV